MQYKQISNKEALLQDIAGHQKVLIFIGDEYKQYKFIQPLISESKDIFIISVDSEIAHEVNLSGVCAFIKNQQRICIDSFVESIFKANLQNLSHLYHSPMQTLNEKNYQSFIRNNPLVILDFTAQWCPPCKAIKPKIMEMASVHKKIAFAFIDIDESPVIAAKYRVSSMPTFIAIRDGNEISKVSGANVNAVNNLISLLLDSK